MITFGITEAEYYCNQFSHSSGDAEKSIADFRKTYLSTPIRTITEGTPLFQQYRDCSLRDVERSLFLAASHYRRSLDLMIPSSSHWAYVTLYYGSWYSAHALLGMFGCAVFSTSAVVDVGRGQPGQQELRFRKIGNKTGQEPTTYRGSHEIFWDFFYKSFQSLKPMLDARFAPALSPISGNPAWQTRNRNDINYDSFISCYAAEAFTKSFSEERFPACLPGALNTQYQIFEALLELAYSYALTFGLNTDALDNLESSSPLRDKVRNLIYNENLPSLVHKTKQLIVT